MKSLWILQCWTCTLAASDCLCCAGFCLPWSYTTHLPEVKSDIKPDLHLISCFQRFFPLLDLGIWGSFIWASNVVSFLRFLFMQFEILNVTTCAVWVLLIDRSTDSRFEVVQVLCRFKPWLDFLILFFFFIFFFWGEEGLVSWHVLKTI